MKYLVVSLLLSVGIMNLKAQNVPSYVPTNGLVGYWPFNGNANDESGNGHSGIVIDANLDNDRFNNVNSSYNFSSQIQCCPYIQTLSNINYNQNELSGTFWFKPDLNYQLGMAATFISGNLPVQIAYDGGGLIIQLFGSSGYQGYTLPTALTAGNWYHFAFSKNQSGLVTMIINGTSYSLGTYNGTLNPTNLGSLIFGRSLSSSWPNPFKGSIDDIAIYNRALTQQEITALYSGAAGTTCTSPIASITSGTTIIPSGGNITLTANYDSTYTYQWLKNGIAISGANSYTYAASTAGSYSVIEIIGICSDTSNSLTLTNSSNSSSSCLPNYLPTNGLVGYWPFCGNANDESGNGHSGIVIDANLANDRFNNVNSSYNFSSQIQCCPYIQTLSNINYNQNELSGSFWFKPDLNYQLGMAATFISGNLPVQIAYDGGGLIITLSGSSGNQQYTLPTALTSGSWYHFAFSKSQSGLVKMVVNGTSYSLGTYNGTLNPTNLGSLIFGRSPNYSWPNPFKGSIDDIAIYNRALTQQEITALYSGTAGTTCTSPIASITSGTTIIPSGGSITLTANYDSTYTYQWLKNGIAISGANSYTYAASTAGSYSVIEIIGMCSDTSNSLIITNNSSSSCLPNYLPTNGLVGYWPFCGNANDESGNGHNGTVNGATLTTDRNGNANSAYSFTNNNINVSNPQFAAFGTSSFSCNVWIKTTATTVGNFIRYDNCMTGANWGLRINPGNLAVGKIEGLECPVSRINNHPVSSIQTYNDNNWHNFTYVRDVTAMKNLLYAEGILVAQTSFTSINNIPVSGNPLLFGSCGGYEYFNGKLDDIAIYNRALTQQEITALFTGTTCTPPTATITPASSTTFCSGGSVILNANTDTTFSYQWQLNGTNISGATNASYTATASGNYSVIISNASNCADTSSAVNVTVNPLPSATIAAMGNTTICSGGSVMLSSNSGTGFSYEWKKNGTAITGATSSTYSATTTGTYNVQVTNSNNCSSTSTSITVTVNPSPTATLTAATSTTFCTGGSVVLNANTGTGLTYQWKKNNTTISGAISASYTATTQGSYVVVVSGSNGCSATSTTTTVTVNPTPTATITAGGTTTFCQGGSVVLNANTGTGLNYQWRNNGNAISTATAASYTANATGSYTVSVTDGNGCSSTSSATTVTVNPSPTATLTAATSTTFCTGGSVVLNANTGTGLTYQWKKNNTTISGAISASYTATTQGSYVVVVSGSNGCSATSTATTVTVNPTPTVTLTSLPSFVNLAAAAINLNGSPTGGFYSGAGAQGSTFLASAAGLGSSTITYNYTNASGCSSSAAQSTIVYDTTGTVCTTYDTVTTLVTVTDTLIINAVITSLAPPNNLNTIKIYPNPTSDHITINYGNYAMMSGYQLKIENALGQVVFTTAINLASSYVDLSSWTGNGIYFVKIMNPAGSVVENRKIVLQ